VVEGFEPLVLLEPVPPGDVGVDPLEQEPLDVDKALRLQAEVVGEVVPRGVLAERGEVYLGRGDVVGGAPPAEELLEDGGHGSLLRCVVARRRRPRPGYRPR
jgi:hypothetical protein